MTAAASRPVPPVTPTVSAHPGADGLRARLRIKVTSLRRIGGLGTTVADLAGVRASTLVSRAFWDDALASVRKRHPEDGKGPARLSARSTPSTALGRDLARARRLAKDFPDVLSMRPGELDAIPACDLALVLTPTGVETASRTMSQAISFLQVHHAARCAGLSYADVRDAEHLSALAVSDRRKGSRRRGKGRAEAPPSWRPSARYDLVDPARDAVALAHAVGAMASADAEVLVHGGSKALLARGARETGVRPLDGFAWDKDPDVAASMAAVARDHCLRHAAWGVVAPEGSDWVQAVVHRVEAGQASFVLWRNGKVTHHGVASTSVALGDHLGAVAEAIRTPPLDTQVASKHPGIPSGSCTDRPFDGDGHQRLDVSLDLAGPVAHLPRSRRVTFGERVGRMAMMGSRVAVIRFEEACPPALRRVAAHVMDAENPIRPDRGPHGYRTFLLSTRLHTLAVASAHVDVQAVSDAADRVPALAAVARCDEGWKAASGILSDGGRDNDALVRFASDMAGWPANKAIARLFRTMPPASDDPKAYVGVVKVAVALAVAAPSRPAMDVDAARDARHALRILDVGFEPLDPILAAAVVRTLSDTPEPASLASRALSVADLWNAFGRCAGRCGIEGGHADALREDALLPHGRNLAGLARISAAWHARTVREERERHDLLGRLVAEERRHLRDREATRREPWAFPAPFTTPVTIEGVEVVPLRDDDAFLAESEAQSSCVASYRGDARRGRLIVHSLFSAEGRSTAGHWVDVDAGKVTFRLFQHEGDQALSDSTPPDAHVRAVDAMVRALAGKGKGTPGERGWQARMAEARRMHDAMDAYVDADALTGARREALLASDMAHLGRMLGRREAALDAPALRDHARGLAEDRATGLARLRARAGAT